MIDIDALRAKYAKCPNVRALIDKLASKPEGKLALARLARAKDNGDGTFTIVENSGESLTISAKDLDEFAPSFIWSIDKGSSA